MVTWVNPKKNRNTRNPNPNPKISSLFSGAVILSWLGERERDSVSVSVCVRGGEELIYIIRGVERVREKKVFGKRAVWNWEIFEIGVERKRKKWSGCLVLW